MKQSAREEATRSRPGGAHLLLDSASDRLPTPDGVALAIMEAWEDERTTVQQLAHLVQTDPALSGRILKLANSAASGSRRTVGSVPEAIVRVGMQTVGQLAIAFSLIGKDNANSCRAFDHQAYWSRCLLMAVLCRGLASATRIAPPEDLFACGLLSRVGILGLATVYPEAYSELLEHQPAPMDLPVMELERFGVDHNELSEAMMLDFSVPGALAEPARYHEAPEQSGFDRNSRPQKVSVLLHLAYRLSGVAVDGDRSVREDQAVIDSISARLAIEGSLVQRVLDDAVIEWREWSKLLELPAATAPADQDIEAQDSDQDGQASGALAPLSAAVVGPPDRVALLQGTLAELGVAVEMRSQPSEALGLAMRLQANIFFVAEEHEQFIRTIRRSEVGDTVYVFSVATATGPDVQARAYRTGADDVVAPEIAAAHLEPRLNPALRMLARHNRWRNDRKELRRIAKELALSHRQEQLLALTDQLTGLPNRREAMENLQKAWCSSSRSKEPFALLILDIDHFKRVNDRFGHAVGDQVLRSTAAILKGSVRRDETIARIGGEEFLLISTTLGLREAVVAAERLRRQLEQTEIDAGGQSIKVTASIGIAARESETRNAEDLLNAADTALYAAKGAGRNCIALWNAGNVRTLQSQTG